MVTTTEHSFIIDEAAKADATVGTIEAELRARNASTIIENATNLFVVIN